MKSLSNEHFYLISEIADKMDIQLPEYPDIKDKKKDEIEKIQKQYGQKLIVLLLRKAYKAKEPINRLLADLMDKNVEEIENIQITETVNLLTELFKKEGFMDFLK